MKYDFSSYEIEQIKKEFGVSFYKKLNKDLEVYCTRWKLSRLQLINYFSVNCLFFCYSELYGDCVLKICNNSKKETAGEYHALLEYKGNHHCALFDSDIDNQVMLLERIKPGELLKNNKSLHKRLSVFSELFNGLHISPSNPKNFPSYSDTVNSMAEYMSTKGEYLKLYRYFEKAQSIYTDLQSIYNRKMLLHGDLHYDNILLNENGEYIIIDPQGFIGDPIFDIPRYLLNEYSDDSESTSIEARKIRILEIICYLESLINVPEEVMKKCFFIDMVMVNYWNVLSNDEPNYNDIEFAERLLNNETLYNSANKH